MTKKRDERSFEDAITRIMGAISASGAGVAVKKSPGLVRQWSDPDQDAMANLYQALALDLAHKEAYGTAPILEMYTLLVEIAGLSEKAACIIDATLGLQTACGQVAEAVRAAKSPTGPGGTRTVPSENVIIRKGVDLCRKKLEEIDGALDETAPSLKEVS